MRSADRLMRLVVAAALGAMAGGCATVNELKDKVMPAAAAAPASPAPASAAARPAAVVNDTPLSPNVQRAFDDAVRAQRAGRTADAERGYRALIQSNPELGGPHANLGVIYRNAGKLAESAAELEQAVKLNPRQPVFLNQLGITYRQLGQFEKAKAAYEQSIDANTEYPVAYLNLGILNDMYVGDAKRATELYERYLALSPGGDPVVTKWVAELKNRKPAQAATAARKEKS